MNSNALTRYAQQRIFELTPTLLRIETLFAQNHRRYYHGDKLLSVSQCVQKKDKAWQNA